MAEPTETALPAEAPGWAALPVLFSVVLTLIFVGGLLLAGAAEDAYMHFVGFAFAGFSLIVGLRYWDRFLP